MLTALLASVLLIAPTDTAPVVLAGAPVVSKAMSPLERAMSRPRKYLADSIVLDKSDRQLTMYYRGQPVQRYAVALGRNPDGPKARRGDGKTPEGTYFIEGRNPQSKYHLSLRVSYPTAEQRARASKRGISAGGDIMIHGLPREFASVGALHRQQDWTEGCVAVTNDEIWRAVPNGARILIKP
jgi:murein L,D-transpeptidase YafK